MKSAPEVRLQATPIQAIHRLMKRSKRDSETHEGGRHDEPHLDVTMARNCPPEMIAGFTWAACRHGQAVYFEPQSAQISPSDLLSSNSLLMLRPLATAFAARPQPHYPLASSEDTPVRFCFSLLLFLCALAPQVQAQAVLNANPGPSNNGGAVGSAIFFDVEASTGIVLTGLSTATTTPQNGAFSVRISTRAGTALGGTANTGPGSSSAGWTVLGTAVGTQGSTGEVSLPIAIPEISVAAGQVVGVAVEFLDTEPRYVGTGTPPLATYANANLTLRTGDARQLPFATGSAFFSSRELTGSISYRLADPVLPANPGPRNNSGGATSGLFFDLQSGTGAVVNGMTIASLAAPGADFQFEVHTRNGTALGNASTSGPATSSAGWTLRGIVNARQGPGEISLPIDLPALVVTPGQTLGVGLRFLGTGPGYFGTASPPLETYSSPGLTLVTGQALSSPFNTGGAVFTSRALIGSLSWRPPGSQLSAAPGPSNNGGAFGYGLFMDLQGVTDSVITGFSTATTAAPNTSFQVQVYVRAGTTLGGTATTGPTSSSEGWTQFATVTGQQSATGQVSLPIIIPDLSISAGQTIGIGLIFVDTTPSYVGTGTAPPTTYSNTNLRLITGEAKSTPFVSGGSFFSSRQLLGQVYYRSETMFRDGFE